MRFRRVQPVPVKDLEYLLSSGVCLAASSSFIYRSFFLHQPSL